MPPLSRGCKMQGEPLLFLDNLTDHSSILVHVDYVRYSKDNLLVSYTVALHGCRGIVYSQRFGPTSYRRFCGKDKNDGEALHRNGCF